MGRFFQSQEVTEGSPRGHVGCDATCGHHPLVIAPQPPRAFRRFHPARRSPQIRAEVAPRGELIAGYVGRLDTEKRVDLLAGSTALDGVRLVIVGAGPAEAALRQQLPEAVFLGQRRGEELAAIYASLDVFVHSGPEPENAGSEIWHWSA